MCSSLNSKNETSAMSMVQSGNYGVQIGNVTNGGMVTINYGSEDEKPIFDPMKSFLDAIEYPLFYESSIVKCVGGEKVSLLDVFVEPEFTIMSDKFELICNKVDYKSNSFSISIIDFIDCFCEEKLLDTYIKRDKYISVLEKIPNLMIVVGEGGMGKSSLMSLLAYRYKCDNNSSEYNSRRLFLKLKDVGYSHNDNKSKISFYIKQCLVTNYKITDIKNSILFLDGFDELCMLSDLQSEKSITDLLIDINKLCKENFCKCVLTTRPTISSNNSMFNESALTVKLRLFSEPILNSWICKYTSKHPKIQQDIIQKYKNNILSHNVDNELIFGIPLTNYMGFCSSILDKEFDISNYTNIFQIYDKIFGEDSVLFNRDYDLSGKHPSFEHRYQLRSLTKEIALEMFNQRRFFLNLAEIDSIILKNIEASEVIKNEPSNMGMVFYLSTNNGIVEFVHLTIQEYFAMDCFFSHIKEAYEYFNKISSTNEITDEDYEKFYTCIYSLVAHNTITGRMHEFLMYKLKSLTMSKKIIMLENKYAPLKNSLKNFLLKDISIFTSDYKTNSNRIIKYLFFNLWNITISLNTSNKDKSDSTYISLFNESEMDNINKQSNFKELLSWMCGEIKIFNSLALPKLDLSNISLYKFEILICDLSNIDLEKSNLNKVSIKKTNMNGAVIDYSALSNVRLYDSTLKYVNLYSSIVIECSFNRVFFDEANVVSTKFFRCNFYNCSFRSAKLSDTLFFDCKFSDVDFRDASIDNIQINALLISKIKISIVSFNYFFNYYNHDDSIIVYNENGCISSDEDILIAMNQARTIRKPVLIRRLVGEENASAYEPLTIDDMQTISLEVNIERLTNKRISEIYSNIIKDLLAGIATEELMKKYDIEYSSLCLIVDTINKIQEIGHKTTVENLFRELDKFILVSTKKMSTKKFLKNTIFTVNDIKLFEQHFHNYANINYSLGVQECISKMERLVDNIINSLKQGVSYNFSSLDDDYDEIFIKSGLKNLYSDMKKYILLKKVLMDIL